MPNPCVTAGAMMQCSFGVAPSSLMVLPPRPLVEKKFAATILDIAPAVNIPPFGMCTSLSNPTVAAATAAALGILTPMPCIPLVPAPWTALAPQTQYGGVPALVAGATCNCAWGGVIVIGMPGSIRTQAG
ncbi:DUF4280 domain-containing protein [Nakamurella antarctica]|uniref:DUF4280 domain-containing protein n=1 Tax=Nakamurella antarctica TaxID=1902245 RepID=A0A3G8ZLB3_9ACTN|nr:DUF4280 domain-containing protein [Nakamurella antarctica]AZI58000.1 DUF4280 domain-containing protein [Nakamurella antarctica]